MTLQKLSLSLYLATVLDGDTLEKVELYVQERNKSLVEALQRLLNALELNDSIQADMRPNDELDTARAQARSVLRTIVPS